jgi:hypothetical protein
VTVAFTPDPPFPKSRGDTIRSGDWNNAVNEMIRLDGAKLERTGGAITGSLTISDSLGVGTTSAPQARLEVNSGAPDDAPVVAVTTPAAEDFLSLSGGRRNNQLPSIAWRRGDLVIGTANTYAGASFSEKLRVSTTGNVGVGVPGPQSRLHVAGGQWDVGTTEGDFKIGSPTLRLKIGVATSGAGAGDARIRAQGGTNRLMLGGGTTDMLVVQQGGVGINTLNTPAEPLEVNGRVKASSLSVGPWPADQNYVFFGANTLNQTQAGNYALLQFTASGNTFLNSPANISFRINNVDGFVLGNDRNISISPTSTMSFGSNVRQMLNLWSTSYGIGIQGNTLYQRTGSAFAWFLNGVHDNGMFNPGAGGARLMALNAAGDLILSARTNPTNAAGGSPCRALVDFNQRLIINIAKDFSQGVTIDSDLDVSGTPRKPGGGGWGTLSDIAVKKDVQPLTGALDTLLRLRGVSFEWIEPEKQGNLTGRQIGMIAQEVEPVMPEWVGTDQQGYKELVIRGFEALTVEAVRELKQENSALRAHNQTLEARLLQLEAKLTVSH